MVPSISLEGVRLLEKTGHAGRRARVREVLSRASLTIPCERYMLCGADADRACVIDLLNGRRDPAAGRVTRRGRTSFAIGRAAPFVVPVKGTDMVRTLAELYDFDAGDALAELEECLPDAGILETRLDRIDPMGRLALSISLAPFVVGDIVVIDGALAHPAFPERFLEHVSRILDEILPGRLVLISTRQFNVLRPLTNLGIHVGGGKIWISDEITPPSGDVARQAGIEEETALDDSELLL